MLNIKYQKLNIKKWTWLAYFFIFGISFIIFLYILIPPGIVGPDSFYHTKMALMIKDGGLIQNFPWLQFTTYKNLFVDHHFGYHYLLALFLSMPAPDNLDALSAETDPLIIAKFATAFFAAITFLIIYWLLRRLRVKAPAAWTLIGLLLSPFLLRLSLIRASALSIIILILGFYFILKKKYISLFILSFIYVWIHGAWPLMLVTVIIYCLAQAVKSSIINYQSSIVNFFKNLFSKINVKLLFACISGLAAGLIINPYFPKTLPFYWFQTIKIAVFNYKGKIDVGAEWYSPEIIDLFINILPILILWIVALAWFINTFKKQKSGAWFFIFISTFFLFYTLKSQRNVEYFIPSAIFFSSLMFTQIIEKIDFGYLKKQLKRQLSGPGNLFYFLLSILLSSTILFFLIFYINFSIKKLHTAYNEPVKQQNSIAYTYYDKPKINARPINHLQSASRWLKNNTEAGEIIFQSNWDIFPELFYFNTQNYYINGLDQTFMYENDKELYQIWLDLVSNKSNPNNTAKILIKKFNASYVLLDKRDENFARLLKKSPNLRKTYEDQESIIYAVSLREESVFIDF